MKKLALYILVVIGLISCQAQSAKPIFVTTSAALASIIREIAGVKAEVVYLVPPGASPHTYSAKPSDMFKVNIAKGVFYSSDDLDGWAVNLPAKNKIRMMDLLPKEFYRYYNTEATESSAYDSASNANGRIPDAHFWTDPLTVKAMVPAIADTMSKLDPENAGAYRNNAGLFEKRLDLLYKQVDNIIQDVKGKTVFLFHPSFIYFIERFRLVYGGSIEENAGVEPSAQYVVNIVEKIKLSGAKAIFSEPQLPDASARSIAEAARVALYVLDPVGGTKGRSSYADLILYNARTLQKALR